MRDALDQQAAIAAMLQTVSQSRFELQSVLDAVIEQAARLCRAEWGFLDRLYGSFQRRVATSSAAPANERAVIGTGTELSRWNFGRAIIEQRAFAVRMEDFGREPDAPAWVRTWLERYPGLRTALGVPLIAANGPIGVLGLWRSKDRPFSQREIALVESFAAQAVIAIENVRLFNETKEALERQTAMSDVLSEISRSAFDLGPVLQTVLDRAYRLSEADHGWMIRRVGERHLLEAYHGDSELMQRVFHKYSDRTIIPRGWTKRAITERRTQRVDDLTDEDTRFPLTVEEVDRTKEHFRSHPEDREDLANAGSFAQLTGAKKLLAVPLLRGETVLGVIVLTRSRDEQFSERQIEIVETFGQQAAIAIENVRLFNETKDALERQTATADVLRLISRSAFDLSSVLEALIETAARLANADVGTIYGLEGDVYRSIAFYGPLAPEFRALQAERQSSASTGSSVAARTGRALSPVQIVDVLADPDASATMLELARIGGYRTILGVPLLRDGVAIGVLSLRRTAVRAFNDAEIALVSSYADQAVIAMENVRLFNETKEALERQTATSEVLKVISSSAFDLQPVFETLIEKAVRLGGADNGSIARREGEELVYTAHAGRWTYLGDDDPMSGRTRQTIKAGRDQISGRVLLEGRSVQIPDIRADPEYDADASTTFRAGLGVPILRAGELLGIIILRRYEPGPFSDKRIELLESFADQAAIAIENVRLFYETREKSAQLEAANRHKSEFLANMSHELRTPLNAIIGFSDVLEQQMFGPLNAQQADYVKDIAGSGRHLLDLVNEILDLAKVEAGRMDLELSEFALADTVTGAMAFVRERAAGHRIELSAAVPPDLGTVVADERKIRQVLLNLLSNAVKFTPDGGQVRLRAACKDNMVNIAVQDTGIGIATEDLPRVFDEFRQVGKASDRSREGTGLGLTLAKRFIELHGGTIEVASELGTGTTFSFAIPVAQASVAPL